MPMISEHARDRKLRYLLALLSCDERVLEVGSGDGWMVERARKAGIAQYYGLDMNGKGHYVGDIRRWRELGIEPESFDFIIGLEVVEHVDCFREMYDILKPGGRLFLTSPVPHWDWACQILERLGLNQMRTSPHDHLIYFEKVPFFESIEIRRRGIISQWGLFRKPLPGEEHGRQLIS